MALILGCRTLTSIATGCQSRGCCAALTLLGSMQHATQNSYWRQQWRAGSQLLQHTAGAAQPRPTLLRPLLRARAARTPKQWQAGTAHAKRRAAWALGGAAPSSGRAYVQAKRSRGLCSRQQPEVPLKEARLQTKPAEQRQGQGQHEQHTRQSVLIGIEVMGT